MIEGAQLSNSFIILLALKEVDIGLFGFKLIAIRSIAVRTKCC